MSIHLEARDIILLLTFLGSAWGGSIHVIRSMNGKFSAVATTMARLDERVKNVESDTARLDTRINELAATGGK